MLRSTNSFGRNGPEAFIMTPLTKGELTGPRSEGYRRSKKVSASV